MNRERAAGSDVVFHCRCLELQQLGVVRHAGLARSIPVLAPQMAVASDVAQISLILKFLPMLAFYIVCIITSHHCPFEIVLISRRFGVHEQGCEVCHLGHRPEESCHQESRQSLWWISARHEEPSKGLAKEYSDRDK